MFKKTLLILGFAASLFAVEITDDMAFKSSYLEKENSSKTTLMIYTTSSCPQCSYMKERTFKEANVAKYLQKHFIVLEKNIHQDLLPDGFEYFGIPTIFFVNKNGKQVGKFVGSARAKPFLDELKKIRTEVEK